MEVETAALANYMCEYTFIDNSSSSTYLIILLLESKLDLNTCSVARGILAMNNVIVTNGV